MQALLPSTCTPLKNAPVLPVDYARILKPWFTKAVIKQGLKMINSGEVCFFTFQRDHAGLVTRDNIEVFVRKVVGTGRLRFVLRDGQCNYCLSSEQAGSRCKHVAALALLCLRDEAGRLEPLMDLFESSPWAIIGRYLHGRSSLSTINLRLQTVQDDFLLLGKDSSGLELRIALSPPMAAELLSLYEIPMEDGGIKPGMISCQYTLDSFGKDLTHLVATAGERDLNSLGSWSKKQNRDASLWMYLARLFFLQLSEEELAVSRDKDGGYRLYCPAQRQEREEQQEPIFQLFPARLHTWELLDQLPMLDIPLEPEQALQFSRVFFNNEGREIQVEHRCRLKNGNEYSLAELDRHRYGTRYLVDNQLFSLDSIPQEERLSLEEKGQLSLFSLADNQGAEGRNGFIVKETEISDFITRNKFQLCCSRHEVEESIRTLKIVNMPTRLILDKYREEGDWCYLSGSYDLGNRKIRLTDLLRETDKGKKMLPGATSLELDDSPLAWFHKLGIERLKGGKKGRGGEVRIRRSEFIALSSQIGIVENMEPVEAGTLAAFFLDGDSGLEDEPMPPMVAHLRSYQKHGTAWLYQLLRYQLGGILADDMGLGKTHQALALVEMLVHNKLVNNKLVNNKPDREEKILIVCPTAVLYHWPEKQHAFFPELNMTVHYGPKRNLEEALRSQVMITTYGILRQDADQFADIRFSLVIFDEMHYLKNRKTGIFKAATRLNRAGVIGLTGTPVENSIDELVSLLSLCMVELFDIPQFRQQFKHAETSEQRQRLQGIITPFILRRTREQVLKELPELSEDIRLCRLSEEQVTVYRQVVDQAKGMVDSLLGDEAQTEFTTVLATITRLKQTCNHLCQLEKCTDWQRYQSGKWDEFTRLILQCMEGGLKVVVFSQFVAMLNIIEAWLADEDIDFVALRGSVSALKRSKRITRFNEDKECKICCASLLAGGTGIDLTGAQVVIHYDRWWNPAKEEQATARVHRMGQAHPVQVYKLVTEGTLEEKIHHLIEKKRQLAADLIVVDDDSILKTLNREELAGLFQFGG